jgi:Na+/proline symporter
MIVVVACVLVLLSAPAGYLAGEVYRDVFKVDPEGILPWAAAAFPPLAAVLALMVILTAEMKGRGE